MIHSNARSMEKPRQVAYPTTPSTSAAAMARAWTGSPVSAAITAKAPSLADQWRA